MRDALRRLAGKSLGIGAEAVQSEKSATELGMDSIMVSDFVRALSEELGMPVHPREVFGADSLDQLSKTLVHAFAPGQYDAGTGEVRVSPESLFDLAALPQAVPEQKLPSCAFILSAPRSGSTLLRAMLSAHPGIFAPPELHLLPFRTMATRRAYFGADHHLDEGLFSALMELRGSSLEEAMEAVKDLEAKGAPTHEVLAMLQAEAAPRLFAEKEPINAFAREILDRSSALCEGPKYVFVHRHPYAVIDSAARTRMPWVFEGVEGDPYAVSEAIWTLFNRNIQSFFASLPDAQSMTLAYEDLVRKPEDSARGICEFLDLPYEPAMLSPHENGRMLHGPIEGDPALGDPNFLKRRGIDASLAEAWRRVELPNALGEPARRLADELGYEMPGAGRMAAALSDNEGKETSLRNETL
jgi:acyl carrier protein